MPANILVTVLYEVKDPIYGKAKTEDYVALHRLCLDSFKEYLADIDEVITFTGVAKDYHEVFRLKFEHLRGLHTKQDCNILYVDLDNLCVKPVEIFGKFKKLNLFCISSDAGYRGVLNGSVPMERLRFAQPWFVTNVKYFPAVMNKKLWEIGKEIVKDWVDTWAYECLVYNCMFHSQWVKDVQDYHRPEFSYQAPVRGNYSNSINLKQAKIIHFHSTRGTEKTIQIMSGWERFK
jgi:hypothetical protein